MFFFRVKVGSNVEVFGFNIGLVIRYQLACVDHQSSLLS
jgi:hypothetical protein